jgi:hypothetical protein
MTGADDVPASEPAPNAPDPTKSGTPGAPETERTDDRAFTGDAAEPLNDATEHETNAQAGEEDGSTPDDADAKPAGPPPAEYPGEDAEDPSGVA